MRLFAHRDWRELPTWNPGWGSETYLKVAHFVRQVSSRAGETSCCDWLRGSDCIRDCAGATTTLGSLWELELFDCWRFVMVWACDCNFTSADYFTSNRNPGGCECYFRAMTVIDLGNKNMFHHNESFCTCQATPVYTQLKWMHMKALKSRQNTVYPCGLRLHWEGGKPQKDAWRTFFT